METTTTTEYLLARPATEAAANIGRVAVGTAEEFEEWGDFHGVSVEAERWPTPFTSSPDGCVVFETRW